MTKGVQAFADSGKLAVDVKIKQVEVLVSIKTPPIKLYRKAFMNS